MSKTPKMTPEELDAFLRRAMPVDPSLLCRVEHAEPMRIVVRLPYDPSYLRPGGTLSGPTLMGLADQAMYLAVVAEIGPEPLTVTTNLNIHFVRKPAPEDLVAEVRLIKLGARLAIGAVEMRNASAPDIVAHATVTYSIPPRRTEAF
jgi:uncharacterized protein (TIGR00369 family)